MIESRSSVSVIIPAYNEQDAVGPQVASVRAALQRSGIAHEIIVVDDGSQDGTTEEAVRAEARVLRHLKNRGYGAAIKTGIAAAKYETIAITDADGTYPSEQIPALLEILKTADMAVGARTGANVSIPLIRKPGKWMLRWLAERIAGQKIPDLNSGLRVFRRELAMQYFPVLSNKFSFTTTITLALLADDYHVAYHPIDYYARVGQSKIVPRHFMDF
ncbi:MAG: glycosyltransferase family 2 protein, partial [Acidobacteriota bacterium]